LLFFLQVLFLFCIFGYLVILIFYKWIAINVKSQHQPSLLLALINMFLQFGKGIDTEDLLYSGQAVIQPMLVVIAVLCVPWMLLLKPLYLRRQHKAAKEQGFQRLRSISSPSSPTASVSIGDSTNEANEVVHEEGLAQGDQHGDDTHEEFDFGEIFVHQAIHTIEYCLGCISNTASYLRLWALSLAHAELSEVLWTMGFRAAFTTQGGLGFIAAFAMFTFWAGEFFPLFFLIKMPCIPRGETVV